jgi:hypothetical protein
MIFKNRRMFFKKLLTILENLLIIFIKTLDDF